MRVHGRLVVATLVALGIAAPDAGATLRVENHNDPAGDPTVISYRIEGPSFAAPFEFQLVDGDYRSFGPSRPGAYTVQALLPAGWQVVAIQCFPEPQSDFAIDLPNGRVTMTHDLTDHQSCAFTNRRISSGSGSPPSSGIAPTLAPSELAEVAVPRRPALVDVGAGRRFAEATVRITRESVIKGRLLSSRGKIVGSARIRRKPGTHVLRVELQPKQVRKMRRRGLRKVMLTLRVAVTAQSGGATHVFKHRVLVKL